MCCWEPAAAETLSRHCSLEPVQACGRNPVLLVGSDPSMGLERLLARGRPARPQVVLAEVALHRAAPTPPRWPCSVSFGQLGLAAIPGTLLWVCWWHLPPVQECGWELDAREPVGCAQWGPAPDLGPPTPSAAVGTGGPRGLDRSCWCGPRGGPGEGGQPLSGTWNGGGQERQGSPF